MQSEELKPCPFCGHSAHIEQRGDPRMSTIYQCDDCGCRLETGEERDYGAEWNRRAEASLSAAEPVEQDENPMRFFADNVDKWGALEWFNRLVDACEDHDRKRIRAFRCADQDEKDMLSLSADTSKMIMSSSAFQLARKHKDEIRSALSAQVQELTTSRPISNWAAPLLRNVSEAMHRANKKVPTFTGGAPIQNPKDIDGWQLVPKEPTHEMLRAMFEAMFEGVFDGTDAPMLGAAYDAALAAAPAKQEGCK